jgi:hypothetical protein
MTTEFKQNLLAVGAGGILVLAATLAINYMKQQGQVNPLDVGANQDEPIIVAGGSMHFITAPEFTLSGDGAGTLTLLKSDGTAPKSATVSQVDVSYSNGTGGSQQANLSPSSPITITMTYGKGGGGTDTVTISIDNSTSKFQVTNSDKDIGNDSPTFITYRRHKSQDGKLNKINVNGTDYPCDSKTANCVIKIHYSCAKANCL